MGAETFYWRGWGELPYLQKNANFENYLFLSYFMDTGTDQVLPIWISRNLKLDTGTCTGAWRIFFLNNKKRRELLIWAELSQDEEQKNKHSRLWNTTESCWKMI